MNIGKEERKKERELDVQRLFPRAVTVIRRSRALGHGIKGNKWRGDEQANA
jgi:hypothetical protein